MEDFTMQQPPAPQMNQLTKDDKTFGMLCHLSALSGFVIPFGTIIGPLVVWLLKKQDSPYVDEQGKEALNFNISMMIYLIISAILILILIGILLLIALGIMWLVLTIIAALKANNGENYKYPLTIRFLK